MRNRRSPLLLLLVIIAAVFLVDHRRSSARSNPALLALTGDANPFIGTAGGGNIFPGASAPFGMVQWSPETTAGGLARPGGYNDGDLIIRGFGLTHLSGAGCVAFDNLPIMPTIRPLRSAPLPNGSPYSDRFVRRSEHASPGYYAVRLASGIGVALTVTPRTALGRFTFPRTPSAALLFDAGNGAAGTSNIDGADRSSITVGTDGVVQGSITGGHFCGLANHYTLYFAARFDTPIRAFGTWKGSALARNQRTASGIRTGAYLRFDTRRNQTVRVKIGLSYVDVAGARRNLQAEDPGWSFQAVRAAQNRAWNVLLNRVVVTGGTTSERTTFYTALYHSLLAPTIFSDVDGRYAGFDRRVHRARGYTQYANFSGWDIYRSEIPLLAMLVPGPTGDMMQSLVADAQQGGRLPKWPVANDYTGEMDGDSADPILAGAAAFGARHFNLRAALNVALRGAMHGDTGPRGYLERPGLASYLQHGWIVPQTGGWGAAAQTLEYTTDDFALAQLAGMVGDSRLHTIFLQRAGNWRRLYNPATGFLQARAADGSFEPLLDARSTTNYVEGNALQYRWMVPYALPGLVRALGGSRAAVSYLDHLFAHLGGGPTSSYDWPGNEPGFSIPWVYDFAGRPARTQAVVRRIISTLYNASRAGLPGNDDLGAMSSWYVWAAIGLYPEVPGVGGFALGSPLFPHTAIHLTGGTIQINAPRAAVTYPYVRSLSLDGRPYHRIWLPWKAVAGGATLNFDLSRNPPSGL